MDAVAEALQQLDGGRVLDVATYQGRFVQVLMDNLRSYTSIEGIDVSEQAIEAARAAISADGVSFRVMNAESLDYDDDTFDTVAISASLHHMADVEKVFTEMKRVLRPGGRFVVVEMHRDAESETELTSVYLHQWAAEVDCAQGRLHNRTFSRQEILDHVAKLKLGEQEQLEYTDTESDPKDQSKIKTLEEVIGVVSARAAGASNVQELTERGRELIRLLRDVGARGEPVIMIVGVK